MTAEPAISVIIPAYNSAAHVREALASVAAQRFRDFEILVVDDASTDNTLDLLRRESSNPPNYRIIPLRSNQGPAAARNAGCAMARGAWLAFLDADDVWLPWRLSAQMEVAGACPESVLLCGGTVELDDAAAPLSGPPARARLALGDFAIRNPVATSTVLVRKSAVEAAGGFDARFRGPEDYDLWMRVTAAGPVLRLDCPLARYRAVAGSLSRSDVGFLPQVLGVLDKAYGQGGVLRPLGAKRQAAAYQYLSCAWMAAERSAWLRALRLFVASVVIWPGSFHPYANLPWCRLKLLGGMARLAGKRGDHGPRTTCPWRADHTTERMAPRQ